MCGLDPDPDDLTATFDASYDGIDENGNVVYTIPDNWIVSGAGCTAYVDAISGDVVHFEDNNEYSKRGTTLGRFHMMSYDSFNDPDTIYLKTAMDIVKAGLAEGRSIDHAEIDGVQFAWDDSTQGQDPDATGTILVDCHIYMESGLSYTISLWGDMSALHVHWFSSIQPGMRADGVTTMRRMLPYRPKERNRRPRPASRKTPI